MSEPRALMEAELRESPDAVERQRRVLEAPLAELLRRAASPALLHPHLRARKLGTRPTFGKHLVERHLGIPVGAFAPNIATIYQQRLRLDGQVFLTVSQSGKSDDLIESTALAKASGALTATIVNETDSPLARSSDIVLPMAAGPEPASLPPRASSPVSRPGSISSPAGAGLDDLVGDRAAADRLAAAMWLDSRAASTRWARPPAW